MPTLTVEYATDAERLLLERAVAFLADLRTVAHTAPHGTVIDACEALAPTGGRKLLRDSLASAVQTRLDAADAKKKSPASAARAAARATFDRPRDPSASPAPTAPRPTATATSPPTTWSASNGCLTRAAERMAAFAGARDSFPRARAALRELAGWTRPRRPT